MRSARRNARQAHRRLARTLTAVGVLSWWQRNRLADRLTESQARSPSGRLAQCFYAKARGHHEGFQDVLQALSLHHEDRLVEIGCGGGVFLELALALPQCSRAIDHSLDMLDLASRRNAQAIADGRLTLIEGKAERLPFAPGEFTVAAMTDVFLVLEDPAPVLAELHRVLAPEGRLAIHTRAPATEPLMRRLGLGWMARRLRFYDDDELAALLSGAGFDDVTVTRRARSYAQLATATRTLPPSAPVGDP
jgi:ubiquinone/menaquinone biosynthesis C-methylase UbiE